MTSKVYQIITDRIIESLKRNVCPWRKPWNPIEPQNPISKTKYHGINRLLLEFSEFENPYWLTWNQIKQLGGMVKKGEKSSLVVFYKPIKIQQENEKNETSSDITEKTFPYLRYYRVFNIEQIDGLREQFEIPKPSSSITLTSAEEIIAGYKNRPEIKKNTTRAYYNPEADCIGMPLIGLFESMEKYYTTLFHEMIHSTGHNSRLNRVEISEQASSFGSHDYSLEELTAEIGSCFLSHLAGITQTFDNSVGYIESWLKALECNPKWIVLAASRAQKSADYIIGASESSIGSEKRE